MSITCLPGQSQPVVHRVMHANLFTLSQARVQGLAQDENTYLTFHRALSLNENPLLTRQYSLYIAAHSTATHGIDLDACQGCQSCWHCHHSHHKWTPQTGYSWVVEKRGKYPLQGPTSGSREQLPVKCIITALTGACYTCQQEKGWSDCSWPRHKPCKALAHKDTLKPTSWLRVSIMN